RVEQGRPAPRARVHRLVVRIPKRPGECALGALLPEHVILLVRQLFPPLGVSFLRHVTRRYAAGALAVTRYFPGDFSGFAVGSQIDEVALLEIVLSLKVAISAVLHLDAFGLPLRKSLRVTECVHPDSALTPDDEPDVLARIRGDTLVEVVSKFGTRLQF